MNKTQQQFFYILTGLCTKSAKSRSTIIKIFFQNNPNILPPEQEQEILEMYEKYEEGAARPNLEIDRKLPNIENKPTEEKPASTYNHPNFVINGRGNFPNTCSCCRQSIPVGSPIWEFKQDKKLRYYHADERCFPLDQKDHMKANQKWKDYLFSLKDYKRITN